MFEMPLMADDTGGSVGNLSVMSRRDQQLRRYSGEDLPQAQESQMVNTAHGLQRLDRKDRGIECK